MVKEKSEPHCPTAWSVSWLCESGLLHFPYNFNSLHFHFATITLNFKKYKSTITLESRIKELYIKQCIVSKVDVTETGNIPFLQLQNSFLIIRCWTTLVDKSFIHNESIVLNKVIIIQGIVTPPPQCTRAELKAIYFLDSQEPSNKRVRPLAKVSSLVNLISPSKNGAVRRFGHTIQVNVILMRYSTNLSCRNLNE